MAWHIDAWRDAGVEAVGTRVMSLGGGLVMWGRKSPAAGSAAVGRSRRSPLSRPRPARLVPETSGRGPEHRSPPRRPAWYAVPPGRWRDWLTVLHPPYTAWHLSYVLIGAGLAPRLHLERLVATLIAFGLAVGVGAHGLDELRGRPLGTSIPSAGARQPSPPPPSPAPWSSVLWGRPRWDGDWRCSSWWAWYWWSPTTSSYGAAGCTTGPCSPWGGDRSPCSPPTTPRRPASVRPPLVGAAFAFGLSSAQRELSLEAREVRRRVVAVDGERTYSDGTRRPISHASILRPLERGLVALSWSTCLLGVSLVLARTGH